MHIVGQTDHHPNKLQAQPKEKLHKACRHLVEAKIHSLFFVVLMPVLLTIAAFWLGQAFAGVLSGRILGLLVGVISFGMFIPKWPLVWRDTQAECPRCEGTAELWRQDHEVHVCCHHCEYDVPTGLNLPWVKETA